VPRSDDDRLSAPAEARARILAPAPAPAPGDPGVIADWQALAPLWIARSGLGLTANTAPGVCLIAPSAVAAPFFDELAQRLVWPVRDGAERWLGLTIDHDETLAPALEALEANVRHGWQGVVLVRLEAHGERLTLRPLTLHGPHGPIDLTLWRAPHRPRLAPTGAQQRLSDWLERLRAA
ncbi:hypothetical protein MTR62_21165, partial [Novosphingobium sp. 1949]